MSRDFLAFCYESNPSGLLINSLKCVFLKIRFRGDICKRCDSVQANTARSRTLCRLRLRGVGNLIFENPKLANTVWSKNNFLVSSFTLQYSESGVHMWIFRKKFKYLKKNPKLTNTARSQTPRKLTPRQSLNNISENPKMVNTARSQTLHRQTLRGVLPASILSLSLPFKGNVKQNKIQVCYTNQNQHFL